MYDERQGRFRALIRPERRAAGRDEPLTWAALAPLALPDLPEAIGRRLVEEQLLRDGRFWLPVPPPSVAADDPTFSVRDHRLGLRNYWRGPTWINAAWLIWLGLVRLGYDEQAEEMAARLRATVLREGLREYYHPFTGAGMGAKAFAWSSLIAELAWPDPAARRSHI
jgi:glycogen debranching enzyme